MSAGGSATVEADYGRGSLTVGVVNTASDDLFTGRDAMVDCLHHFISISFPDYRAKYDDCRNRIPASIWITLSSDNDPMCSPSCALSTVDTFDTSTTLCLDKFASPVLSSTLPGSFARFKFDVKAQTTTVLTRLWLMTSS
jgi:hypothetical protein